MQGNKAFDKVSLLTFCSLMSNMAELLNTDKAKAQNLFK